MSAASTMPKVLHVILKVQPTNGQYNEHCLPFAAAGTLTVCSFLPATLTPPEGIAFYQGDGTIRGGWRALRAAVDHDRHDVVHVHAPQTGAILLLMSLARRLSLANAVYTVQNSYGNYRRRNRLLMAANFVGYRRIVFCGEATRASMSRLLRRLARGKAYVVPNAVDLAGIDRVAAGVRQDGKRPLTVVWLGRLVPIKDPMVLLDAFDRARQGDGMRLVIVGDGALRPALESEIARRGLESDVCITGMVDRQAVYRHVAAADLFVSVSRGEGLPVAVLEAMACRIPVVLSDIPPHREVATGLDVIPLVPPGDAEGFATEIRRMAARSRDERSAIGARCRQVVEDRYGLAGMHQRYRSIYADAKADGQGDRSDGRAEGRPEGAVEDRT